MSISLEGVTGRAPPDDEAKVRGDLVEFYDAGLKSLADAAVHWVSTGDGFEELREQTSKAGAMPVTPSGQYEARNKYDQALRIWHGTGYGADKELKQTVEMQSARFYEALCGEREWSADDFRMLIQQHPILSRLAERLIWQALDSKRAPLAVFRPLGDGTMTDAQDRAVTLNGAAFVKLAHLAAISAEDAEAWVRHFADYEVAPLFPQLTRPRRTLPPELGEAEALEDRQGWVMDTFKLRSAATKRGWKRGPILDGGGFETYERALPGMGLKAVLTFSGSMVPEENVPAALHSVRFECVNASGLGATLPLADVPPVLLSEVWNDFHDIAAAGAFDAEWEKVSPW